METKIIKKFLSQGEKLILDLIFPHFCLACEKEGEIFCSKCQILLKENSFQFCPFCEKNITRHGEPCVPCQNKETFFKQLIVAGSYQDKLLKRSIHLYKYRFITELAKPLADFLLGSLQKNLTRVPDFIVPVPLHPKRLRWRGFNQAELLSKLLGQKLIAELEIPIANNIIRRRKNTACQMDIKNSQQRQSNLANAFELVSTENFQRKNLLVIDDVCTTGNTLLECCRTLSELKPASIVVAVLARQEWK